MQVFRCNLLLLPTSKKYTSKYRVRGPNILIIIGFWLSFLGLASRDPVCPLLIYLWGSESTCRGRWSHRHGGAHGCDMPWCWYWRVSIVGGVVVVECWSDGGEVVTRQPFVVIVIVVTVLSSKCSSLVFIVSNHLVSK